jgi:hypothetical protein
LAYLFFLLFQDRRELVLVAFGERAVCTLVCPAGEGFFGCCRVFLPRPRSFLGLNGCVFIGVLFGEFAVRAAACCGVPGTPVIVLRVIGVGTLACFIGLLTRGEVLLICLLGAARFPDDATVTFRAQRGSFADEAVRLGVGPPEMAGDLGDRFAFDVVQTRDLGQVDALCTPLSVVSFWMPGLTRPPARRDDRRR